MLSKSTSKEVAKEQAGREAAARPSRGFVSFEDLDRMFDRMFEDFLPRRWMRPFSMPWTGRGEVSAFEGRLPSVDVIDRENEVVVKAELPGVDKKDLDVSMGDNAVTIKASSHQEEKEEKGDYYRPRSPMAALSAPWRCRPRSMNPSARPRSRMACWN